MKGRMENVLHHLRETGVLFGTNKVSNLLSLVSTTLVFLFLGLILVGWRASALWIDRIRAEAEIQVFLTADAPADRYETIKTQLAAIPGVDQVAAVSAEEAQDRMRALLGGGGWGRGEVWGYAGVFSHVEGIRFRPYLV